MAVINIEFDPSDSKQIDGILAMLAALQQFTRGLRQVTPIGALRAAGVLADSAAPPPPSLIDSSRLRYSADGSATIVAPSPYLPNPALDAANKIVDRMPNDFVKVPPSTPAPVAPELTLEKTRALVAPYLETHRAELQAASKSIVPKGGLPAMTPVQLKDFLVKASAIVGKELA